MPLLDFPIFRFSDFPIFRISHNIEINQIFLDDLDDLDGLDGLDELDNLAWVDWTELGLFNWDLHTLLTLGSLDVDRTTLARTDKC